MPRDTARSRVAVSLLFALSGSTAGGWAARAPDVRRAVRLGDTAWGLANMAATGGSLVAIMIVAVLIGRVSSRRLTLVGAAAILANAPLLASASGLPVLLAGLVVWGMAMNLLSTPMNAQAVEVERRYGRPILSGFHACYSFGLLAGGSLGTVAASTGVAPATQLATTSLILGALLLVTCRWQPRDAARPAGAGRRRVPLRDRFTPQLRLLGVIALLSSIIEGGATQWSAIYTSEALRAGPVAGAATYTCYAVAAAVTRLRGDRVIARVGRSRFVRLAAATTATGMALVLIVGTPIAAYLGFAVIGLGAACVIPTVYGLGGNQPELSSGEGVSVVSMGQWPGFLLASPLIGLLAGAVGLRTALVALVGAALATSVLAGRIRDPATDPQAGAVTGQAISVTSGAGSSSSTHHPNPPRTSQRVYGGVG